MFHTQICEFFENLCVLLNTSHRVKRKKKGKKTMDIVNLEGDWCAL
jgi:hypothetical protein